MVGAGYNFSLRNDKRNLKVAATICYNFIFMVAAGFSLRNEIHNCGNMINWQGRDAHRSLVFSTGEKMDDILPAALIVMKVLGFRCWVLGMDVVGAGFSLRNDERNLKVAATVMINTA